MEDIKKELHFLVDSIDNIQILANLKAIVVDYVQFYIRKQKNVKG